MTDKECFDKHWKVLLNKIRKMGRGSTDPRTENETVVELLEDGTLSDYKESDFKELYAAAYIQGMADALDLTLTALVDEYSSGEDPEVSIHDLD